MKKIGPIFDRNLQGSVAVFDIVFIAVLILWAMNCNARMSSIEGRVSVIESEQPVRNYTVVQNNGDTLVITASGYLTDIYRNRQDSISEVVCSFKDKCGESIQEVINPLSIEVLED